MAKQENFDERYHSSYTAKLKTIPLEKIEHAIAGVIGGLTNDRVECTILNLCSREQSPEILIRLTLGSDKRYSK